jgi:hypothetical protein
MDVKKAVSISQRVMRALRKSPKSRSKDNVLLANIWYNELKEMGLLDDSLRFLEALKRGALTNPDRIKEVKESIQEDYPELRGHILKSQEV